LSDDPGREGRAVVVPVFKARQPASGRAMPRSAIRGEGGRTAKSLAQDAADFP